MKTSRLLLPLLVILTGVAVFTACNKYKDKPYVAPGLPEDQMVTASVQGRVLDEKGVPVQGAAVTSDTASTTTDVNGVFSFSHIAMSSRFGYVKVVAPGYFAGSRSIITSTGGTNYVTITLIPRTAKGTFPATGGGVIVVQTGDTVNFDPSAIVTASTNAAYSGTVHVYAAYLDPTSTTLSQNMPGDLRGIGSDGKETVLQTFGMMVVELEGDGGEKLQIASGKQATINMTIPDTLRKVAQASIPLWYFNDTTGRWMEQGSAARVGNSYVGKVGHFTFWNWDAPYTIVNFKVRLVDTKGNGLDHIHIQFVSSTYGVAGGYTDSTGFAQGLIPKGQTLQFQVLTPCNTVAFGENVGPTLGDQDLGTLTVDLDTAMLNLTGTVVDCSNNPLANGVVGVVVDGLNYRIGVTNGVFATSIIRCSGSATQAQLTPVDLTTQQQGQTTTLSVKSGTQDVGQLSTCGTVGQSLSFTINGTTYSWAAPPDNITYEYESYNNTTYMEGSQTNKYTDIYLLKQISGTGSIDFDDFTLQSGNALFGSRTLYGSTVITHCNITAFGPVGGYIVGTLSGNVYDSVANKVYPITGNLQVKRTN